MNNTGSGDRPGFKSKSGFKPRPFGPSAGGPRPFRSGPPGGGSRPPFRSGGGGGRLWRPEGPGGYRPRFNHDSAPREEGDHGPLQGGENGPPRASREWTPRPFGTRSFGPPRDSGQRWGDRGQGGYRPGGDRGAPQDSRGGWRPRQPWGGQGNYTPRPPRSEGGEAGQSGEGSPERTGYEGKPTRPPAWSRDRTSDTTRNYRAPRYSDSVCTRQFDRPRPQRSGPPYTPGAISPKHINLKMQMLGEIAQAIGARLLGFFEKVKFLQTPEDRRELAIKAYESVQRATLKQLNQMFAESSVILPDNVPHSNEGHDVPGSRKREVYADPLVGWENFCTGCSGWGILLSTYFDGVCEAVVLYDPLAAEEYSAGLQQGAFLNRHRLRNANSAEVVISDTSDLPLINSRALAMAYAAAGRATLTTVARHSPASWQPMLLLLKEARVKVTDSAAIADPGSAHGHANIDANANTHADVRSDTDTADTDTDHDAGKDLG